MWHDGLPGNPNPNPNPNPNHNPNPKPNPNPNPNPNQLHDNHAGPHQFSAPMGPRVRKPKIKGDNE